MALTDECFYLKILKEQIKALKSIVENKSAESSVPVDTLNATKTKSTGTKRGAEQNSAQQQKKPRTRKPPVDPSKPKYLTK